MTFINPHFLARDRQRWLRPDWQRYARPDAARWLRPDAERRIGPQTWELKYRPDQPRVPAGNPDGGQWTRDFRSGGSTLGDLYSGLDKYDFGELTEFDKLLLLDRPKPADDSGLAGVQLADEIPAGTARLLLARLDGGPDKYDFGDQTEFDKLLHLDRPKPVDDSGLAGVQLAGEIPAGIGHNNGPPLEPPPEIPQVRPATSAARTRILKTIANVIRERRVGRSGIALLAAGIWALDHWNDIIAASDEPKTLEELQANVGKRRIGYDDHHIVEQTSAERSGFPRSKIDDRSNLVSIPRLKHYDITGWYGRKNECLGWISPRQYLKDKSWEERMRVGRKALIDHGVLKP